MEYGRNNHKIINIFIHYYYCLCIITTIIYTTNKLPYERNYILTVYMYIINYNYYSTYL